MMEAKRKEFLEAEKRCLPTRHYLTKYILPHITQGLTEVAKVRPTNPVEFLANFLLSQETDTFDEDLDDEVVKEFRRLVDEARCKQPGSVSIESDTWSNPHGYDL